MLKLVMILNKITDQKYRITKLCKKLLCYDVYGINFIWDFENNDDQFIINYNGYSFSINSYRDGYQLKWNNNVQYSNEITVLICRIRDSYMTLKHRKDRINDIFNESIDGFKIKVNI